MKTKWNWLVILSLLLGMVCTAPPQPVSGAIAGLTIEPASLPDAMITVNFQLQLIARYPGGSECSPCLWYTTLGTLPDGVTLNGDTGYLEGKPTTLGSYTFTVVVEDRDGVQGMQEYTWNVIKVKTIVDVGTSSTYVGNSVPTSLGAAARHPDPFYSIAPTGKMSFSVDGTPVPGCSGTDALSTNSWGQAYCISYVPTGLTAGSYDIQAEFTPDTASSGLYQSATGTGTLQVNPPQAIVSGLVFMDDNQNTTREESEVAQGTWNVNLNQDCDSFLEGDVVTNEYTGEFTFYPVPIDGHTYCLYVNLSGYPAGYVQTTPFNNLTLSGDQYFEIGVYYPHITIRPNSEEPLRGSVGTYFEQTFEISGGTPPYTIDTSGTLPEGLTFDLSTLILSGTPTAGGWGTFLIDVADSDGITASAAYSVMILSEGVFNFTSSANPSAPGDAVTFTVSATGEVLSPYGLIPPIGFITFSADGTPIDGCSDLFLNVMTDENGYPVLDADENPIIGNYPAVCTTAALETGTHMMTATYFDPLELYFEPSLQLTQQVGLAISPETLPNAEYQASYSQQLSASGGVEPYAFLLISGALPSGINLSSTGLLSGFADWPAAPGTYPITIQVMDAYGSTANRNYELVLDKGVPTMTVRTDTNIFWSLPFDISVVVEKKISESSSVVLGGTVAFFIDDTPVPGCGAVPEVDGYYQCQDVSMVLTAPALHEVTAVYTPTGWYVGYYTSGSGSSEFTVQSIPVNISGEIFMDADQDGVRDEGENRISESSWTVNLDQGCDGKVDYTQQTFSGIFNFFSIPVSGQCHRITVDGTPGYQQTTELTDFYPGPGTAIFIEVGFYYPTIIVSPSGPGIYDLPNGTIGEEYSQTFTASGGKEPYVYTIAWGSLPQGLTLGTDGMLSGTPTVTGYYNFTVQAEDADGAIGQKNYNLSIERIKVDGVFIFTSSSNPSTPGQPVTFTVSATGDVVLPDLGSIPPVGFITFSADGSPIEGCSYLWLNIMTDENGNPVLDADGIPTIGNYPVTCSTAALETGIHEITATFYDMLGVYNEPSLILQQVVSAAASADLAIDKTDSKDPVKPGSKLTYTLTVSNLGPDLAEGISMTDKLDSNTTYDSISVPRGWTCGYDKKSGIVTCTSDSLASGESVEIKITVKVNKTAKVGKELVNNAFVSSTTFDPDLVNNAVVQKTLVAK